MSNMLKDIQQLLHSAITSANNSASFFKTQVGGYAEHDAFMGVPVPKLREIAKKYAGLLTIAEIEQFLNSPFNEERLLALFILVDRYQKGDASAKEEWYHF